MRRTASPRVEGYAILAGAALLAALVLRRPELAVAAAPFALVLALGLRLARDPAVRVDLELAADRTLESSRLPAELSVRSESGVDRLELLVDLPEGVGVADSGAGSWNSEEKNDPARERGGDGMEMGSRRAEGRGGPWHFQREGGRA